VTSQRQRQFPSRCATSDSRNIRSRISRTALVSTSSLLMIYAPRAGLIGGASNGMLSE